MARSALHDFEILSKLGSGSFGVVHKVKRIVDKRFYVIKSVRIAELSAKEQSDAINEVGILAQLKSAYVVRYYDSFIEKGSLHIVMEFCNRGDLQNLLKKAKEKDVTCLKEDVIWNILLQVMLGLAYLHRKNILHRDLKTANVFLMKEEGRADYLVKIGDLGVAKLMDTSTALASTIVGTPYYLSPELCKDMPYRDKSDCWAFGVLLYECCTLKHPFEARNQCALILKIIDEVVTPPPSPSLSNEIKHLILWLLQKNPDQRPNIREIINEEHVRRQFELHNIDIPEDCISHKHSTFLSHPPRSYLEQQQKKKNPSQNTSNSDLTAQQQQEGGIAFDKKKSQQNLQKNISKMPSKITPEEVAAARGAESKAAGSRNESPSAPIGRLPSQRNVTTKNSSSNLVQGNRVRDGARRMPSERALSRNQIKPPIAPHHSSSPSGQTDLSGEDTVVVGGGGGNGEDEYGNYDVEEDPDDLSPHHDEQKVVPYDDSMPQQQAQRTIRFSMEEADEKSSDASRRQFSKAGMENEEQEEVEHRATARRSARNVLTLAEAKDDAKDSGSPSSGGFNSNQSPAVHSATIVGHNQGNFDVYPEDFEEFTPEDEVNLRRSESEPEPNNRGSRRYAQVEDVDDLDAKEATINRRAPSMRTQPVNDAMPKFSSTARIVQLNLGGDNDNNVIDSHHVGPQQLRESGELFAGGNVGTGGDEDTDLWNTLVVDDRRSKELPYMRTEDFVNESLASLHYGPSADLGGGRDASLPDNHSDNMDPDDIDIEPLQEQISAARERAMAALGNKHVFKQVYDLCSRMLAPTTDSSTESTPAKKPNASNLLSCVEELDKVLFTAGIDSNRAVEITFGVKVLLALEQKYQHILDKLQEKEEMNRKTNHKRRDCSLNRV